MRPTPTALTRLGAVFCAAGTALALATPAQAAYPPNPVQTSLQPAGDAPNDIALSADDSVYVLSQNGFIVVFTASLDDSRTYPVGASATAIAVDSNDPANPRDDSVYITSSASNHLIVYGNGMDDSQTISLAAGTAPGVIAVDQTDDTVYVGTWQSLATASVIALRGANLDDSRSYPLPSRAQSIAVDSGDDTIYIANGLYGDPAVLTYSGPTFDDSAILPVPVVGSEPWRIAVSPVDDSVYVGLAGTSVPSLLTSRGNFDDSRVRALASAPASNFLAVTVAQDGSTVYAVDTNAASGPLYVMRSTNLDDSTAPLLPSPSSNNYPQAVAASGTIAFTANGTGDSMSIVRNASAPAITTISPASGPPAGGNTVTISGAGFVPLVSTVRLGGAVVAGAQVTGPTTMTFTVPAHPAGSEDVTVTTGLLSATVVNGYTWVSPAPPPPDPVLPPSPPTGVNVEAADRSGLVSWRAPASSGSFPITDYRATALPGGHLCLAPATELSCEITGLVNGTSYTVTVEALNGASWSQPSAPSATFVPRGAIVIVGSRESKRIRIFGRASGWAGEVVLPRFRLAGQSRYRTGYARPTVASDGSFTWSRRTKRKAYVYVKVLSARSNRVIIGAAQ